MVINKTYTQEDIPLKEKHLNWGYNLMEKKYDNPTQWIWKLGCVSLLQTFTDKTIIKHSKCFKSKDLTSCEIDRMGQNKALDKIKLTIFYGKRKDPLLNLAV